MREIHRRGKNLKSIIDCIFLSLGYINFKISERSRVLILSDMFCVKLYSPARSLYFRDSQATEEEFLFAFWKSSDERRWYSGVSDTGWTLSRLYINENKPEWHLNYTLMPLLATTGQKRNAEEKDERDQGVATHVWEKLCQLNQEASVLSLNDKLFHLLLFFFTINFRRVSMELHTLRV